jgi:putative ABC transport system permease protein
MLTARAAAAGAFDSLFLGLGVVALIVGAVGVANIMIISVLERRSGIGLRRALGATKSQIRTQFLAESILLAVIGGVVGVLAGHDPPALWVTRLAHGRLVHPRRLLAAARLDEATWSATEVKASRLDSRSSERTAAAENVDSSRRDAVRPTFASIYEETSVGSSPESADRRYPG